MKRYLPSLLSTLSIIGCQTDESFKSINAAPTALITAPQDGETTLEGYPIEARGQVSDTNHGFSELETAWFYGAEEICTWRPPDAGGGTSCVISPTLDEDTIRLEVRDPVGSGGVDVITLSVLPSENPVAEILSPASDQRYYSNQMITFQGKASDAEDAVDQLEILWTSSGEILDIPAIPDGSGEFAGAVTLPEGEHFIELTVTDQSGKTDTDNVTVRVGPANSIPSCSILSPILDSAGTEGDVVLFEGVTQDADVSAADLVVEWFSDRDGLLGYSTPTSQGDILFAYSDLSVNTHNISMVVTDDVEGSCTAATVYTVGNPPSVQIISPLYGSTSHEGEAILFDVRVSDAQDQPDELDLDWTIDGQSYAGGLADSTGIIQFSIADLSAGTHVLSVVVTDTDGLTNSEQVAFTINGMPSQPIISISPTSPFTTDDLSVSIDSPSIDPEGLSPSYSYQWFRNGVPEAGATTATLSATATSKSEIWSVQVTPSDGLVQGPFGEALTTIENAPPSDFGLNLESSNTPDRPTAEEDDLLCSVNPLSIDVDNDPLTYIFDWIDPDGNILNGGGTAGPNSSETLPASEIGKGGEWTCSVSVSDGSESTGPISARITVENICPENGDGSRESCPGIDCSQIYQDGWSTGDGSYWIALDGSADPFPVYCDMSTHNQGWTQVGYELAGDAENLAFLGLETGSAEGIATRGTSGLIGTRFSGQYEKVWIEWNNESIMFTPSKDIFVDSLERIIPVVDFSTSDSDLSDLNSNAGGMHFCRAAAGTDRPGETSWALKPFDDTHAECGCSAIGWGGNGAYYSGVSSATTACTENTGGFTGVRVEGETKSETVPYDTAIYVFRDHQDQDQDGIAAWEDCDDTDSSASTDCPPFAFGCEERFNNGDRYWFCTDRKIWFDAQGICALNGGNLATVNDVTEHDWLATTGEMIESHVDGARWWIGLHDNNSEGSFEWISGESSLYTNWNSNNDSTEPSNGFEDITEENCTSLFWGDNASGWNDLSCANPAIPHTFICEF